MTLLQSGDLFSPFGRGGMDTSDGWCNAPPIFSFSCQKKKRKRAVHGPKEKKKYAPCGGRGDAQGVPLFLRMSPARGVVRAGVWRSSNGLPPFFAAAHLAIGGGCPPFSGTALLSADHFHSGNIPVEGKPLLVGPDPLVRPFPQGLPFSQQNLNSAQIPNTGSPGRSGSPGPPLPACRTPSR